MHSVEKNIEFFLMLMWVVHIVTSAFCRVMMLLIISVRDIAYRMTSGFFTLRTVYTDVVLLFYEGTLIETGRSLIQGAV